MVKVVPFNDHVALAPQLLSPAAATTADIGDAPKFWLIEITRLHIAAAAKAANSFFCFIFLLPKKTFLYNFILSCPIQKEKPDFMKKIWMEFVQKILPCTCGGFMLY